jgi:RHS repeat-associated protein
VPGVDALQFISHEEGRMRVDVTNTTTPNPFDYFIKDHLGNVRMVLTDEVKQDVYPAATLENVTVNGFTAISKEDDYYTVNAANVVSQSTAISIPVYQNNNGNPPYNNNLYSNTSANSTQLYRLNATTNTIANKIGLGIVLKVMAGDQVNVFGKSYHKRPSGQGYPNNVPTVAITISEILSAFTATSLMSPKGILSSQISGQASFPSTLSGLIGNQPNQNNDLPKASIEWIILDEQFKYVSGGFDMVGTATNSTGTFKNHNNSTIPTISIPKNGYIYVYCANESKFDVFFDNLQLIHTRGPILEETHYYPFGLTQAGISSKALNFGNPENKKNKFQDQEYNDDLGVDLYEFKYRMDDPQIGRFWQIDPLADKFVYNSTYAFSENKVTGHIELEGLEAVRVRGSFLVENGELHQGATTWAPANDPYDLGDGTLYDFSFDGGTINGKYYKPMQISFYAAPKVSALRKLMNFLSRLKSAQFIIFGNGHGGFDMGSPIDYSKPIPEIFDFAAFQELMDLANKWGSREDANPKTDPVEKVIDGVDGLREQAGKKDDEDEKPRIVGVCSGGCHGSPHDGVPYFIFNQQGDTAGLVNWSPIGGASDTTPKKPAKPAPVTPTPITPKPKPRPF